MEPIGEILKQTRINISRADTGTWSGAEAEKTVSACPLCQGAGFVHSRLPSGNPDFSRVVACRCTKEKAAHKKSSRLQSDSGLAKLQRSMTFENFDWKRVNLPPEQRENLKEAFRIALEFAKSPEGWIVFMGETGCGKTHLAAAIANYCLASGKRVLFVVVPDFLDHLRSTFRPDSAVSYDEVFEAVRNAPLLVLDDFGEQSTTPWAREKLYQIINYRYNERLPTLITTWYSLDDIHEKVEPAIASRLVDPTLSNPFNITAPDFRGDSRCRRRRK